MANKVAIGLIAIPIFAGLLSFGYTRLYGQGHTETFPAAFAAMDPIDSHVHVYKDDPALGRLLTGFKLHFLNILLIDHRDPFFKDFNPQYTDAQNVARSYPGRIALCTTFSPYAFEQPGFAKQAIAQLDANFKQGAVAVKIYKTIGMEIKTKAGTYLMPDDPVFDPIYNEIARRNRTIVAHLAEPTSCWQAPNTASPDYSYYNEHPEEYAHLHPEWPLKETILKARDHMLEKHPNLRVVGAHLGSMEVDVDEIAKRFDRYPNFAVDTAARVEYLMLQPRSKVRAFLIQYQDRVLYGTDFNMMPEQNPEGAVKGLRATYQRDWTYFATNDVIKNRGRNIQGLGLPDAVLRKLYHGNAVRWIPGLAEGLK